MTDPLADLGEGARADRFQHEQAALGAALRALLGRAADDIELVDLAHADAIAAEFVASRRAAEDAAGVVEASWPESEIEVATDTVHRIARNVGTRLVWLIVPLSDSHVASSPNDVPLDNPLGFAALTDNELRLLDRELPAGLWLVRHAPRGGADHRAYTWELAVWGEPWASAATRALRGVG